MNMKLESWAQAVEEEMARNGYKRIVAFDYEISTLSVWFWKGSIQGRSSGPFSDYSSVFVRAAIAAYQDESGEQLIGHSS